MLPLLQALLALGAVALGVASLWHPALRDASGSLLPVVSGVWAVGLALGLVAAGLRSAWSRAANWAAITLLGQAASLQLIRAGTDVHYQHYRLAEGDLPGIDVFWWSVLALQAGAVGRALWRHRGAALRWCREQLGVLGTLFAAGVFIAVAAFPSRELSSYGLELLLSTVVRSVALGSMIAVLLALPSDLRGNLSQRLESLLSARALVVGCALFATLASALLADLSYERHPHVPDEVGYIMHARYFAEGAMSTPAPPVPEAFDVYLWPCKERCYSPVPPGWPAMLAVGVRLGVGWLVNPLLAGLGILLTYRLLRLLYDERTSRLSALLLAMSPWYLSISMSWMSHAFSLVCALIAAISVARMAVQQKGQLGWALLGGVAIGLVSLTRPLEGVIVAGVLGLAALGVRGARWRLAPAVLLGASTAVVGMLVFPYNAAITGSPTQFPIMAYADEVLGPGVNSLGFGPERGIHWGGLDPFPGHGLADAAVNTLLNTTAIDGELFGWALGSTLPIVLLLLMRSWRRNDAWLAAWVAAIVVAHVFYWYSGGPDFAARYWYLAIVPLAALGVRGLIELDARAGGEGRSSVLLGAALLSLSALLTVVPWRAIDKYHHYRGMQAGVREILAQGNFENTLLLVRGEQHPDYASALVYTALDPHGGEAVVAWDRSAEVRDALRRAYPERETFVVEGPTITGAGYRLLPEPLPALPSTNERTGAK